MAEERMLVSLDRIEESIMLQSGVKKDIPAGATVSGYPTIEYRKSISIKASILDLPQIRRAVVCGCRG